MSRHLFYAPGKREARTAATPAVRAVRDALFVSTVKAIAERGKARLADGAEMAITMAALNYYERKQKALKAAYFRQRYGRDYWTGQRRHMRARTLHWNEGYQDEADGQSFNRRPPTWPAKRWRAYAAGAEVARDEIAGDRNRAAA